MKKLLILPAFCAALSACGSDTDHVSAVSERVVYQKVFVPVPQPCPVTEPVRPGDAKTHGIPYPRPTDLGVLVDLLLAKLKEWDGPGKYADQTHDAIGICTRPPPPVTQP